MVKTTVYLPEALKRRLERVAAASGASEAALIRKAVEELVDRRAAARPRALFSAPALDARKTDEYLTGFGER